MFGKQPVIRKDAIKRWFAQHDPSFERPFDALAAGFRIEEVAWMYGNTFSEQSVAYMMARDLVAHTGLQLLDGMAITAA